MKRYIIYSLLGLMAFTSCKKEAALKPSNADINYFVIKDNPSDSVDHAIYLFYTATKIPIFYKDTLGQQTLTDQFGVSYVQYQKLGIDYNPDLGSIQFGIAATYYVNLKKKANVIPAIKFLNTYIIPALPSGIAAASFFCTDTLNSAAYGTKAFKGFNTVVMGSVPRIATLTTSGITAYRAAMLRAIVSPYILDSKNTAYLTANFYSVSRAFLTSGVDIYSLSIANIASLKLVPYATYSTYTASYLLTLGFLSQDPTVNNYGYPSIYNINSPPTYTDVNQYLEAIFTYNTAQFTTLYGNYAPIMKKYNVMKGMLTTLGFTLN